MGIGCGEYAVEEQLDQLEGSCSGAGVTRVTDAVTTNGDACVVGIHLLWAHFADNACVGDIGTFVLWDVIVVYGAEGVSSVNLFFRWLGWIMANALAEAAQFIGVGCIPGLFVGGVCSELPVF